MRHHHVPVNDALNRSTRKGGLPWQLWFFCVVLGGVVMAILSIPFGLLMVVALPAILVVFFRKDERIVELAYCSTVQKSYYDPGKAREW